MKQMRLLFFLMPVEMSPCSSAHVPLVGQLRSHREAGGHSLDGHIPAPTASEGADEV